MKRDSTIAVAFHAKAVAVMLYFMQPLRPSRNLGSPRRDAELERLKHVSWDKHSPLPRGLLGKAVPMLPISSTRIDTPDKDDVLRALLVMDSKPRKRALKSSADLPRLVMKRLMQNMARSEKTPAR